MFFSRLIAVVGCAALVACGGSCEPEEPSEPAHHATPSSWYLATIEGELGPVPFFLRVPAPDADGDVVIRNGSGELSAEHSWQGSELRIEFRHWGTSVEAELLESGELEGVWVGSRVFNRFEAPFSAVPIDAPDPRRRFPGEESADAEVEGVWRADFEQSGWGELRLGSPEDGIIEGTIVQRKSSGGDFGTLAGNMRGNQLYLSTFDGQKAFRLDARVGAGDQMIGRWESVGLMGDRFMAVRGELEEELSAVAVGEHNRIIEVPGLDDPRYEDRAAIVVLFGTWCTTCGHLAPVIRDLYDRYRDRGLEVHAVAYEAVDDESYIEGQIARYRERYGADWPIVTVAGEVEPQLPAALQGLEVLPITMFRNRDGTIRAIRTGFVSPASGDTYTQQVDDFEELTKAILADDA